VITAPVLLWILRLNLAGKNTKQAMKNITPKKEKPEKKN